MAGNSQYPKFLEAGKVAEILHASPKTVARWAAEGKIPSVRTIGGHRRFDPAVIQAIAEKLAVPVDGAQ